MARPSPTADAVVVGGGIVGTLTALRLANAGTEVVLIDAEPRLWSGASAANEGKLHLGPIFALGDDATHAVMQEGALRFTAEVEESIGQHLDWDAVTTSRFTYLAMPDGLVDAADLARRYAAMNARFRERHGATVTGYPGGPIDHLVDPRPTTDEATGLPAFATTERAIEPVGLGELVVAAVQRHPRIDVRASTRVTTLRPDGTGVDLALATSRGARSLRARVVVNATWAAQGELVAEPERNFRAKCAVRLRNAEGARTVTLVQGAYGDVVAHRDYAYLSWYPIGRVAHEFGRVPSAAARTALAAVLTDEDHGRRQVQALVDLGLAPAAWTSQEVVGGFIVGHGDSDIEVFTSPLHARSEFAVAAPGRVVTPRSFKFTTGPLAARRAADVAAEILRSAR